MLGDTLQQVSLGRKRSASPDSLCFCAWQVMREESLIESRDAQLERSELGV